MDFPGSILAASISSLFAAMFFLITSITASLVIARSFSRSGFQTRRPFRQVAAHRIIPEGQPVVNADYLAVDGVHEAAAHGKNGLPALPGGENLAFRNTLGRHVREELLPENRPEGVRIHRAESQHVDSGSIGEKVHGEVPGKELE